MNKIIPFMRVLGRKNVISHYQHLWGDTTYYYNMNQLRCTTSIITDSDKANISRDFMGVFPDVMTDLTEICINIDMPDVSKWLSKVINYNVPGSKETRGLETILAFKILCPESELTDENLKLSYILGWCVEIYRTYLIILDDIVDNGVIRRGSPCWHRYNEMGYSMATNDFILLSRIIYQLLKKHFNNKSYYIHILELFHRVSMKTGMGQSLEMIIAHSFKTKKFKEYTMDNHSALAKNKATYCTHLLPLYIGMIMDDFLSCFGDPKIIGKIGRDIEEAKCSWPVVIALQRANSHQKRIMEDNYGIDDQAKVKIIKNLYDELEIQTAYQHYEEETYNVIFTRIQQLPPCLPQKLFVNIFGNYKNRKF